MLKPCWTSFLFLLVGIALTAVSQPLCAAEKLPNVVLIYVDDLGYGDIGCYGATKVQTPNIDRLAKEGRRFTDAHSASAVCTPSRYALLTGEYPVRAHGGKGVWGPLPTTSGLIIDTDKLTIGKVFQNKGYATACLGKWHLGFKQGTNDWQVPLRPGPLDVGFDHYFGVPLVNSGSPFVYVEDDTIVGYDPSDPLVYGGKPASPTPRFPPEASQKSVNRFGGALEAHKIYDDEKTGTLLTERAVEPELFKGMILMAAYPPSSAELDSWDGEVLSIAASEDGLVDPDKYEEGKANLPDSSEYVLIEGGNHAGFGSYGDQSGDGEASISREAQHILIVEHMQLFFHEKGFE